MAYDDYTLKSVRSQVLRFDTHSQLMVTFTSTIINQFTVFEMFCFW